MSPPVNNNPASLGQINKLVSLGHGRDVIQNVTGSEAGALIRAGMLGKIETTVYAWKKTPPAGAV